MPERPHCSSWCGWGLPSLAISERAARAIWVRKLDIGPPGEADNGGNAQNGKTEAVFHPQADDFDPVQALELGQAPAVPGCDHRDVMPLLGQSFGQALKELLHTSDMRIIMFQYK